MSHRISDAYAPAWIEAQPCRTLGHHVGEWSARSARRRSLGVLIGLVPDSSRPDAAALGPQQRADYFFFLCALLFDFRGFDIVLDGVALSGADAFFTLAGRKAQAAPNFFTAGRLVEADATTVQSLFSVSGRPEACSLRRCDERAALLRDAAGRLLRDFGGSAWNLLSETEGRLRRPDGRGLMDRLDAFAGYRDPHFKKGFVLVKALETLGDWRAVDREHLYIPVDYHLMRVALRSGIVETTPAVAETLRQRRPATDALDDALRAAVKLAYKEVERASGLDIFTLDEFFWTLGRSCCHYGRPPRCQTCDFSHCTVMRSFEYACAGQCPLNAVCRGARQLAYAALYETNITTVFY